MHMREKAGSLRMQAIRAAALTRLCVPEIETRPRLPRAACRILLLAGAPSGAHPLQRAQPHPPPHRPAPRLLSGKKLTLAAGGRPAIARKASRTKSPMATSLNNDACGSLGHSWFADQNRKAVASTIALASSIAPLRCAA